jgi:ribonuclease P protein component
VFLIDNKNSTETAQVMVSVPKKRFKRAVKRNRIKRLLRETYRLNKQSFVDRLELKQLQIQVAFNYVSDEELDFISIDKKMKIALQKLIEKIETFSTVNC